MSPLDFLTALEAAPIVHVRREVGSIVAQAPGATGPRTGPVAPAPPPAAAGTVSFVGRPEGTTITLGGQVWGVQSGTPDGVAVGSDGSVRFRAASVDGPPWQNSTAASDPPRKIRAEIAGRRLYGKGEPIRLEGVLNVDPATVIAGSEWSSLIQIHQADTRRANGVSVVSSPLFTVELRLDARGAPFLEVRGETGRGVPAPNVFSPIRVLGRAPFALGRDHAFALTVVDGHGGPGRIAFALDGRTICDFAGPTGYEYVDLLARDYLVRGEPQPSGSYLKLGIYSGLGAGQKPPAGVSASVTIRVPSP